MIAVDQCTSGTKNTTTVPLWGDGYSSTGGFFVFTGVMSMLIVIATLLIYLFLMRKYESDERLPLVVCIEYFECISMMFFLNLGFCYHRRTVYLLVYRYDMLVDGGFRFRIDDVA